MKKWWQIPTSFSRLFYECKISAQIFTVDFEVFTQTSGIRPFDHFYSLIQEKLITRLRFQLMSVIRKQRGEGGRDASLTLVSLPINCFWGHRNINNIWKWTSGKIMFVTCCWNRTSKWECGSVWSISKGMKSFISKNFSSVIRKMLRYRHHFVTEVHFGNFFVSLF